LITKARRAWLKTSSRRTFRAFMISMQNEFHHPLGMSPRHVITSCSAPIATTAQPIPFELPDRALDRAMADGGSPRRCRSLKRSGWNC
jgi:hypothetical protein